MIVCHQIVHADLPVDAVYAYLADFSTTNEWDPRASHTRLVSGDGGVASRYTCDVAFLGRSYPMTYVVTDLQPPRRIEWVGTGSNKLVLAEDIIELTALDADRTRIDYTACFTYRRVPRLMDLVFAEPVRRLCDDARSGLEASVTRAAA